MPWGTSDAGGFQAELFERGQQRAVRATETGWIVEGSRKLSDSYDSYTVTLNGRRYTCSCYSHAYGEVRRRRICGHVKDVIVWRKLHETDEERARRQPKEVGEPTEPRGTKPQRLIETPHLGLPNDPHHEFYGEGVPLQFSKFRQGQLETIAEIVSQFRAGRRVVILDAPTGSGKTFIAEMVRRTLKPPQTLYVCNTKSLQDQFAADFEYAAVLKGRSNYPTADRPDLWPDVSAEDCSKREIKQYPGCSSCPILRATDGGGSWGGGQAVDALEEPEPHCDDCHPVGACPYLQARSRAEIAKLAVLNTAYLLVAANGPGMFRNRGLVVCDEADQLEGELMRHIEVVIGRRLRNKLRIDLPPNVGEMESWARWLRQEVIPKVRKERAGLSSRSRNQRKRRKALGELIRKINAILPHLDDNWVVDGYEDARRRQGTVERQNVRFRPVRVADYAGDWLWQHGNRWLLMSATVISASQMAEDLGLADGEWAKVEMDSTFPPERRPIFLDRHVGPVTQKTQKEAYPALAEEIALIVKEWPDQRILIHTHSYRLTEELRARLKQLTRRPVFTYSNAQQRDGTLNDWLTSTGILLAPSLDRGLDLYKDYCRVQVIAKAPFPYLGDKQVSKRMRSPGGQGWYVTETVRSIVQATGRVMRSETDWGATYVLDGSVWRLLGEQGQLFPKWWRKAVVRGNDVQSRTLVEGFGRAKEDIEI
ncbi:MAG: helicase C-terminal domain-containing protein [Acidimicrobiia bacterium]